MDSRLGSSRPTYRATSTSSGTGCRQGATFLRRCGGSIFQRRMVGCGRWAFQRLRTPSLRRSPDVTWSRSWNRCSIPIPTAIAPANLRSMPCAQLVSVATSNVCQLWNPKTRNPLPVASAAVGVGALSGFFGIGGGFLIVRGLLFSTGMPMICAIGSSLLAVGAFRLSNAVSYGMFGLIDWPVAAEYLAGGLVGGLVGMV